ncbi:MAG: hypothetical protein HY231_03775 [Acidobacteria bacterium]|nr:hypothetical protein [Acidobacteriota bacterium]
MKLSITKKRRWNRIDAVGSVALTPGKGRHEQMFAVVFAAEFASEPQGACAYKLSWLAPEDFAAACFYQCRLEYRLQANGMKLSGIEVPQAV